MIYFSRSFSPTKKTHTRFFFLFFSFSITKQRLFLFFQFFALTFSIKAFILCWGLTFFHCTLSFFSFSVYVPLSFWLNLFFLMTYFPKSSSSIKRCLCLWMLAALCRIHHDCGSNGS